MATRERWELKQMQALPLDIKVQMTQRRIRDWYEYWDGNVYVSFSGGKDSTVLKHLVDSIYDDVPSTYFDTGLEYPEIKDFVKSFDNVEIIRPELTFKEVIKKHGYPLLSKEIAHKIEVARNKPEGKMAKFFDPESEQSKKYGGIYCVAKWEPLKNAEWLPISRKCCNEMKKKPAHKYAKETGQKPYVATMAAESKIRETIWIKQGCNAFESNNPISTPMSFWTENDVWAYIKKYNLDYASVYGEIYISRYDLNQITGELEPIYKTTGCDRTGCVFCGFGCHLEKEPNRFQRLKMTHPKLYDYCINGGEFIDGKWQPSKEGLGMGKVLDFIGVKY